MVFIIVLKLFKSYKGKLIVLYNNIKLYKDDIFKVDIILNY